MDRALVFENKFIPLILLALAGSLLTIAGIFPEFWNYKVIILLSFSAVGLLILSLPTEKALLVFFFYLGIEGSLKLLSRYHPVIHVGADIIVLGLVVRTALQILKDRLDLPKRVPFLISLIFMHFLWFLIVFMNPYALSFQASLAAAKLYVVPQFLFLFGFFLITKADKLEKYFVPWSLVAFLHIVFGLYQGAVGPSSVTDWSPSYQQVLNRFEGYPFRPFGLASMPGGPAVFSYFLVPIFIYYFLSSSSWLKKFFSVLMIFGFVVILLLCQVKSAIIKFLGAIFLFLVMALVKRNHVGSKITGGIVKFLFAGILLVSFALPYVISEFSDLYSDNQDAVARSLRAFDFEIMGQARKGALDRFLTYAEMAPLGSGLSRIGPAVYRFHDQIASNQYFKTVIFFSDNLWVQLVIDIGIPGVFLFTAIIFLIFLQSFRAWSYAENGRHCLMIAAIFTGNLAIFSGSYGAEPILYHPEAGFFWFFSGALFRLSYSKSQEELS